jgi:hypothetical protein
MATTILKNYGFIGLKRLKNMRAQGAEVQRELRRAETSTSAGNRLCDSSASAK